MAKPKRKPLQEDSRMSGEFATGEGSAASKKPKSAMTFFAPLTRLAPGRHSRVVPDSDAETYILEIDAQSSAICRDPLLAVALSDNTARVLSKSTLQHVGTFKGHTSALTGVKFGKKNPNLLFTSAREGAVKCYDMRVRRGKAQQVFTGYEGNVFTSFDMNCDDDILCAGTEAIEDDAYLIFWDRRSTNLLGAYKESHSDDVTQVLQQFILHVKFHPNKSDWLATGSTDGLVCVFDISQSSEEDALVTTLNSESSVSRIGWCGSNSEYLFGLTHTESIHIWDAVESSLLTRFDDVRESLLREDNCRVDYLVDCFYHSSLKSLVVLGGDDNGEMQLLTVGRDRLHPVHPLTGAHKERVRCLHWDNRRECLLTGGEDATLSVWQPEHTPTPTPTNNNPSRQVSTSMKHLRRSRRKLPAKLNKSHEPETRNSRKAEKRGSPQKSLESPPTPTQPAPEKITKRMQRLKIQHSGKPYKK